MANTLFDPLRLDPFSTSIEQPNQVVPYGNPTISSTEKQEQVDDVLLQFANSPNTTEQSARSDQIDQEDVRKSRKERIIHNSPRSVVSPSSLSSRAVNVAPPPEIPRGRDFSSSLFHMTSESDPATQPKYELITHSGSCMARISIRTKLLKLWKDVFWIVYDDREFMVFKTKNIFEEWLMNPYLSRTERMALVKMRIDFLVDPGTHGYQVSNLKPKYYRKNGMLHQFKLDKWDFGQGPSILAAFGSSDPQDAIELLTVLKELLRKSPANVENMGYTNVHDMNYEDSERGSASNFSGGDSVFSTPTFARPPDYMHSTRSV